ncbi:MAG: formyl transferase [Bacteroidetes bacterium]|nr:formyl transferase [Bacteroidota bacterium]
MQSKKIVFLASDGESSRWVYNALSKEFEIGAAIIEQPISKKVLFKGRLKRIGFFKVMGQVLFSVLVVPILRRKGMVRKLELIKQYQLDGTAFNESTIHRVSSVNDAACMQLLQQIQPDIVVVNGTRIISKKILQCTPALFINMHVGITPWYRGSHGGYWAVKNKDIKNFGTTIHLVDAGVDTGGVLQQAFVSPSPKDNFTTYPVLQVAVGIAALKDVLQQVMNGTLSVKPHAEKGAMYYQPTVWAYLWG